MDGLVPAPPPVERVPARSVVNADLSDEIVLALERQPRDRVTCRRIFGDNYRCNWWAPMNASGFDNPGMVGLTVTTHRVRQSRCLTASRTEAGLVLSVVPDRRAV